MDKSLIAPDAVKGIIKLHVLIVHAQHFQACVDLRQLAHLLRCIQWGHIKALLVKSQAVAARAASKIQDGVAVDLPEFL